MDDFAALILRLQRRLRAPLPGLPSQLKMIPSPRPGQQVYTEVEGTSQKAGVMILLYPRSGAAHLVFIRRPEEVDEILEIPLDHLRDPANARRETWTIRGEATEVPFYSFGPHKIWGATAMVLAEFLDVLGPGAD